MALNGAALGNAMKTAVEGMTDRDAIYEAMGNAIVNYLKANATVMPTALISPGGLSPAPVTGTGTIT